MQKTPHFGGPALNFHSASVSLTFESLRPPTLEGNLVLEEHWGTYLAFAITLAMHGKQCMY